MSFWLFFSGNHFFILWLGLELNSIVFICILLSNNKVESSNEGSLIYFLVQSLSSIMLLLSMVLLSLYIGPATTGKFVFSLSILIKLGSFPLQGWMVLVSLRTHKLRLWLLLTLQKFLPMVFFFTMNLEILILVWSSMLSSVWGSLSNMVQNNINLILTFSSVSNSAWLIVATLMSKSSWMFYFLIYSFLMLLILKKILKNTQTYFLLQNNIHMFFYMLSLGGLPPLIGFFPKIILLELLNYNNLFLVLITFIFMNCLDFFVYVRMSVVALFSKLMSVKWKSQQVMNSMSFMLINIVGLISVI